MTWTAVHSTQLARQYEMSVQVDNTYGDWLKPAEYDKVLNKVEEDGWEIRHVMGLPRDPLLFLWKPTPKKARLVN